MELKKEDAHVRTGIRSLLSNPVIFDKFQKLLGLSRAKARYVSILQPKKGMKILDIGCGTADIVEHLPPGVDYHGYDLQPEYIEYAARKFRGRGKFYCQDAAALDVKGESAFDVVMINDIVHHLNDEDAKKIFKIAQACLKDNGFLSTIDIIKIEGQSRLARYIMSKDRGQNVRTKPEYEALVNKDFTVFEEHVLDNMYYVPYTCLVIKARKKAKER